MDGEERTEAVKYVRAERVSTGGKDKGPEPEEVCVVEEAAVLIDVEGFENYNVLCTPTDIQAMAVGFLFTEGVIERIDDVAVLKCCDDDPHTVRVRLADLHRGERLDDAGRNLLIVSSCGACGSENLRERIAALPKVGEDFTIGRGQLRSVYAALRERQRLFEACGGTHAAAVFDSDGEILAVAEDAGRHNALDKAIGKCVLARRRVAGLGVALTSRLSLEMVSKCVRSGIELVAAVSAPTSMAIEVADSCNITLCAFVRDTRATVFTHRQRIAS
jgi:FdhD protein